MNKQEELFFQALSQDRTESANMLEKPSMRGVKNSVVEKYSDQAHFIYELLQNADDAGATNARFILEPNRLIFAHNGTRHFSVSDPTKEDHDSLNGTLGDINAITSIANSNKTEASIGKFGVGFKAVFQYTSTPRIYDPNFRFRIDRFIVPTLLAEDFSSRRPDETLFVFPFDHSERNEVEAYNDISDKLKNLSFPLLFLTRIKEIEFEFNDVLGLYGKEIKETLYFEKTLAEHICLTQNNGDELYDEELWLFSRMDDNNRKYSVGFFMDDNNRLRPVNEPAFCYFPTKETTGLNFIIHAPFLLTDSREGIRAGVTHNDHMISLLAELAAKSIVHLKDIGECDSMRLIDDNIFSIIPYDPKKFSDPNAKNRVSFRPFYDAIKDVLKKEEILPSTDCYVSSDNAYWAAVPQLTQLFSNEQIKKITGNSSAFWVFVSIGRDDTQSANRELAKYIDALVKTSINDAAIINGRVRSSFYNRYTQEYEPLEPVYGISGDFIEAQDITWLHRFYRWLSVSKNRVDSTKNKPFFLDQNRKAAAAFDNDNQAILFLPVEGISGYKVVHPLLLEDSGTKAFISGDIGIKTPELRDQIYNIILPFYKKDKGAVKDAHFKAIFEYYCEHCMNGEDEGFVERIKDSLFFSCKSVNGSCSCQDSVRNMYLPTPDLEAFFETKPDTLFIDYDKYYGLVGEKNEKQLRSFLIELGIKQYIETKTVNIDYHDGLPDPNHTKGTSRTWTETVIEGCKEIINYIVTYKSIEKSTLLWNGLISIIKNSCSRYISLSSLLEGRCYYFHYKKKIDTFDSSDTILLKQESWIVSKDGRFFNAGGIKAEDLSNHYDLSSPEADELLAFLGILKSQNVEDDHQDDDSNLTDSQREMIEFAQKVKALDFNEEDFEDYKEFKRQKEARKYANEMQQSRGVEQNHTVSTSEISRDYNEEANDEDYLEYLDDDKNTLVSETENQKLDKKTSRVVKDIVQRAKNKLSGKSLSEQTVDDNLDVDQDEYTPAPINYSTRIERAKQKSAAEIERIAYFEELQAKALETSKYSYGWFKALLELESINGGEANANSKEISIAFAKVEREPDTKRTLVLKHPDRYIPQFMEDLADIPLVLHMGDQTKTVAIEVANIKSYTLRVKMKNSADIDGVDLSSVSSATIDAKSPAFLLDELRKQFLSLGEDEGFEDDYDMQGNLCENIEFVFGPPGTGKTTHLAQNVLIPMMQDDADCKVLVLTPTNKSADVLVRRIMEVSKDTSYDKWLVRFGATGDEEIEQSPVFRDKTFDIRRLHRNVTVTTIARFPYDFFMPQGARIFLHSIKWDYIVIDEASMIPVANIVFPLYKKTPRKFIIAGDPFQIEPITSVDLWKNENIYTMVQLNSFTNPKTVPHQYKVELLTTQYRSIPDIGYVFSHFAYDGILQNYRSIDSQRPLNVGDDLGIETLNIIKFPVSKYESVYRCKRLQHSSSYQVYSALFTFEYVCYLSKAIAANNPESLFKIGVIAPYRAQADMIDKLLASERLPKEVDVQVGTIHSFQGDECDIIFAVFNTPPTISASKEMFLNKRNIINVSISRAKDYLFIVMPDDNTENITNLRLVKRVEQLMHDTDAWNEFLSPDLEELMFGDSKYLENNAFSTSHQSVNVYGLPEKCYEVRTEDAAVDVQIHKVTSQAYSEGTTGVDAVQEEESYSKLGSRGLDEYLIPKELRRDAITIHSRGAIHGIYCLVPYNGKLKNYTDKKTIGMYILQMKGEKEKRVSVSVVEEDKIIYISKDLFKQYRNGLCAPEGLELRM